MVGVAEASDNLLSTSEAARQLHVGVETVRKWARAGKLPVAARREGRGGFAEMFFNKSDVERLLYREG